MISKETVLAFVEAINAHDVNRVADLMSDGHVFIDAHENHFVGKDKMSAAWRGYFEWFPDYYIEVTEIFEGKSSEEDGQTFAMFGFAGGSFKGKVDAAWRLPAAWRAIVKDGRVALWQVFADTKIPFDIINSGG